MKTRALFHFGLAGCTCLIAQASAGATIPVDAITNNSGLSATVASQIQIDVTDAGGGLVDITVTNNGDGSTDFVIAQFYIDDASTPLLSGFNTLPANWGTPGSPPNVPSGNTVGFFADLSADADPSPVVNGIDITESATFTVSLAGGTSFGQFVDGLNSEAARIGLHIQSIGVNEQSDSVVTTPEPGSLVLLGLGTLLAVRRRR